MKHNHINKTLSLPTPRMDGTQVRLIEACKSDQSSRIRQDGLTMWRSAVAEDMIWALLVNSICTRTDLHKSSQMRWENYLLADGGIHDCVHLLAFLYKFMGIGSVQEFSCAIIPQLRCWLPFQFVRSTSQSWHQIQSIPVAAYKIMMRNSVTLIALICWG